MSFDSTLLVVLNSIAFECPRTVPRRLRFRAIAFGPATMSGKLLKVYTYVSDRPLILGNGLRRQAGNMLFFMCCTWTWLWELTFEFRAGPDVRFLVSFDGM